MDHSRKKSFAIYSNDGLLSQKLEKFKGKFKNKSHPFESRVT